MQPLSYHNFSVAPIVAVRCGSLHVEPGIATAGLGMGSSSRAGLSASGSRREGQSASRSILELEAHGLPGYICHALVLTEVSENAHAC